MRIRMLSVSLAVLCGMAIMSCGEPKAEKARRSVLAGSWYEGTKAGLEKEVDAYLHKIPPVFEERRVLGLISPHAGYVYSGQAAAYGYARVKGADIDRVVILAPSHRVGFRGISVPDYTHYETPLGRVPVDRESCKRLLSEEGFTTVERAHTEEHSLEIQLPFLQRVVGDFELVPMVVGEIGPDDYEALGRAVASVVDARTLVVASSDFTHYGPRFGYVPFEDDVKENLKALDMGAVEKILARNREGFVRYRTETGATICGACPIGLLMEVMPASAEPELLAYYTSGDVTGEWDHSVSYVSLAFFEPAAEEPEQETPHAGGELSAEDRTILLDLARRTLRSVADTNRTPDVDERELGGSSVLTSERGVFVTLKKDGRLRGCIGHILPQGPLYRGVIENAFNAGWRDHRFPPLQASEIPELDIEISVLSVPVQVGGPEDIRIGEHGVILHKSGRSAVFLPQVAPEQGWDVEDTLTHLAMKAGLPPDGWRSGAEFSVFTAEVFHE